MDRWVDGWINSWMEKVISRKKNNALESIFIELINSKKQNISIDLKGTGQSLTMKTSFQIILIYISLMF